MAAPPSAASQERKFADASDIVRRWLMLAGHAHRLKLFASADQPSGQCPVPRFRPSVWICVHAERLIPNRENNQASLQGRSTLNVNIRVLAPNANGYMLCTFMKYKEIAKIRRDAPGPCCVWVLGVAMIAFAGENLCQVPDGPYPIPLRTS
jgi:hypothetical protein